MSFREKINKQLNTALKSKNKNLISTLRLILAGIKDYDIANRLSSNKEEAKDSDIINLLKTCTSTNFVFLVKTCNI